MSRAIPSKALALALAILVLTTACGSGTGPSNPGFQALSASIEDGPLPPLCRKDPGVRKISTRLPVCEQDAVDGQQADVSRSCIEQLSDAFTQITNPDCQRPYRDRLRFVFSNALMNHAGRLSSDNPGRMNPEKLDAFLRLYSTWYSRTRNSGGIYDPSGAALWASETSAIELQGREDVRSLISVFFSKFLEGLSAADVATELPSQALRRELGRGHQVLKAALDQNLPGEFLVEVTGEILFPFYQRIKAATPVADLYCLFKGCSPGENARNPLHRKVFLLAAASQQSTLREAISTYSNRDLPELDQLLGLIADHYDRIALPLNAAIASGSDLPAPSDRILSVPVYESEVLQYGRKLHEVLAGTELMRRNHSSSGLLVKRTPHEVPYGFTTANLAGVRQSAERIQTRLVDELRRYQDARRDVVSTLLRQRDAEDVLAQMSSEHRQLSDQLISLLSDRAGLQAGLTDDDKRSSAHLASLRALTESSDWNQLLGSQLVPRSLGRIAISARSSRYIGATEDSSRLPIDRIAVLDLDGKPYSTAARSGDVLTFSASGEYSPTCALRKSDTYAAQAAAGPATGTRGFMMVLQNGQSQAVSDSSYKDSREFTNSDHSKSQCWEFHAGIEARASYGVKVGGFGADVSAYAGASYQNRECDNQSSGTADSTGTSSTTTHSKDSRESASFEAGIRSSETPFPSYPAGALLLVHLPPGETNARLTDRIEVVQNQQQILVEQDGSNYLVVNDCGGNSDGRAISVEVRRYSTVAQEENRLTRALLSSLAALGEKEQGYLGMGQLTGQDLRAAEDEIYAQVASTGLDLQSAPPQLGQLYRSWISSELARMERKVRIQTANREVHQLMLRIDSLQERMRKLAATPSSDRRSQTALLGTELYWAINNMDIQGLGESVDEAGRFFDDFLFPAARFRLPGLVPASTLNSIRNVDVSTSFDEIVRGLVRMISDTKDRLDDSSITQRWEESVIALSFPRPGATPSSNFITVASDVAAMTWESIESGRRETFLKIDAGDLYMNHVNPASSLSCYAASPVIESMAYFFGTRDSGEGASYSDTLNSRGFSAETTSSPKQLFSGERGFEEFSLPPNWTRGDVPVLFGTPDLARRLFSEFGDRQERLSGVSPFGTFQSDFSNIGPSAKDPVIRNFFSSANELIVLMRVRNRSSGVPVAGVRSCGRDNLR